MIFIFVDFLLGLLNLFLCIYNGSVINGFTAGFCLGVGTALLLDKIMDHLGD